MEQQHLGLAEEEKTARLERIVEAAENAPLGFHVEIHQRITANQEIQARRILHQVITPKDQRAAHIGIENLPPTDLVEIFLPQIFRHRTYFLYAVGRWASRGEGVEVGVSCGDVLLPDTVNAGAVLGG